MPEKRAFPDLFNDPSPALNVKVSIDSDEKPQKVLVRHRPGGSIDRKGRKYIESICKDSRLYDFAAFYHNTDGLELCTPVYPDNFLKRPHLQFIPARHITDFTAQYVKKGKWAWTIDLNKSKEIYRGADNWVIFAIVDSGPACLSIFLDGENAGGVYLITPQPHFNILKPIDKTFDLLLERIAKDPAAFLRLVRAYVTKRGADGQNYGCVAAEYLGNSNTQQ